MGGIASRATLCPSRDWNTWLVAVVAICIGWVGWAATLAAQNSPGQGTPDKQALMKQDVTQGCLRIVAEDGAVGECPLMHTDVNADISGFTARVKVTQTFLNPTREKTEAVYAFPLPHQAAVDEMITVIGERRNVDLTKRRGEAWATYEQALLAGQRAEERPNIFTQPVGNIEPKQEILVKFSYVDMLRYDKGGYEFHFPMVVGPRYNPGTPTLALAANRPKLQGKVSPPVPDTTLVPDASHISPPVLKPSYRTIHDVSLSVKLDAGMPIQDLKVTNHRAGIERSDYRRASVVLADDGMLPNKNFVLRYDVVGKKSSNSKSISKKKKRGCPSCKKSRH